MEAGAAAQVLKRFFHTDRMSFSLCSYTLPAGETCDDASPTLRQFTSFSQAADENAVSRIYVGFHFRDAVETGTRHGERIADRAVNRFLRPAREGFESHAGTTSKRHRAVHRGRPDATATPPR